MTVYNDTLAAVLARLQGSPSVVPATDNVIRAHQTVVTRDQCPAVRVIDGRDEAGRDNGCTTNRSAAFTVRIICRGDDDAAIAALWVIADAVMGRLNPEAAGAAYPAGAVLIAGAITPDHEIADLDVIALDMNFSFTYNAAQWSLTGA